MKKRLPFPFKYILLIALVLGTLMVGRMYLPYLYWNEKEELFFYKVIIPLILDYLCWALFTPLMYSILQRNPLNKFTPLRVKLRHVAIGVGFASLHEFVTTFIYFVPLHLMDLYKITPIRLHYYLAAIPAGTLQRFVEYCFIMGAFVAYDYYHKYQNKETELANMEAELSKVQLNALKMQLHPHFLFNTLNTVSALMEENIQDAQSVVAKLGSLLRTMLDQKQRHTTSLQHELVYVKNYLDIEQTRFHDRLEIVYDIAPNTTQARVPSLIFQPLIENAIKHGFAQSPEGGKIEVRSSLSQELQLILEVEDDGKGSPQASVLPYESQGIGLANVKQRLEQLYGNAFTMDVISPSDELTQKGFLVKITIPFELPQ
ncbi:MAG TPA: hypothetical protein DCS93_15365 [Microscillaceae bacterium]|nr:hypothetical protein [Microscillaceae bacterium]